MFLPSEYFQKLVESCPDIIIAVDKHGTIVFYNDGARQNLGFTQEEMLGTSVLEVYPSREEAKKVMAGMRSGVEVERGKVRNFETTFRTKKGEQIPVAVSASVIYDEQGREVGSIGFAKDLREIKRRDQLATLGEIAVGVSHEINNCLEVLVNNINLVKQYMTKACADEDYVVEAERLDSIEGHLSKIQEITQRVGEMAEIGTYGTKEYHGGKRMADLGVKKEMIVEKAAQSVNGFPLEGLRLLVVDDDLGVCHSLKDLLRKEKCVVDVATSGKQAIERLAQGPYDLVISDVVMPDMDGYELYSWTKEKLPHTPVVLMTAFYYDKDHVIKRSRLDGLQCVIFKKPINPNKLKKAIFEHCRGGERCTPTAEPN